MLNNTIGITNDKNTGKRRILNCIPSINIDKDWLISHAEAAGILKPDTSFPKEHDLRDSAWWSIGDQYSTGSCVGWATSDAVLRWHFVKAKKIKSDQRISVRFTWMASKEMDEFTSYPSTFLECDGTSLKSALDIARKYGAVTDDVLPFDPPHLYDGDIQTFYAIAARLKIKSYFNLSTKPNSWKKWLYQHGPILTALNVDETWDDANKTKGILEEYKPDTTRGGHAVAIVGYTEDYFIIRNSWGKEWGDNGFAYAKMDYAKKAFQEAYGVVV